MTHLEALGWCGHILCDRSKTRPNPDHNIVAIRHDLFERIIQHISDGKLPNGVQCRRLGFGDTKFIASGTGFSIGSKYSGTIFHFSEDEDLEYQTAMQQQYGIYLPSSRYMIGCFAII